MAASPVNIVDGVRWNAAFAYLDPVRDRPNLTIAGELPGRSIGPRGRSSRRRADTSDRTGRHEVQAERVVVAGGTYGSPAVLLRSGIGEPDELRALGHSADRAFARAWAAICTIISAAT